MVVFNMYLPLTLLSPFSFKKIQLNKDFYLTLFKSLTYLT